MTATPTQAAATVRQRLCDWAAYEQDAAVLSILRELIRATDTTRLMLVMECERALADSLRYGDE
jgi:hypothetical protein